MGQTVIDIVNHRIIALLEKGTVPWRAPWNGTLGPPRNLISNKPYQGLNQFLLSHLEYSSPYFLTFNQIKKLGGNVRKGEVGHLVTFWKWIEKKVERGEESGYPLLRYYKAFNLEQCCGIEAPKPGQEIDFNPINRAEEIIKGMPDPTEIKHRGSKACYRPSTDQVILPAKKSFTSEEEYYSTTFHELIHATGHRKRLAREGITKTDRFASEQYSKEELIAEMGAAYLCAEVGIEQKTLEASASYIQSWLKELRNDKRLIFKASSAAQKAVEYITKGDERLVKVAV